ncbi:MAG TPA: O-antigen ligase family protein [Gaiellaceae bacterium]|nr:O-antigen ligase family protein [Gaiellaceae bacterium]
MSAGGGLAGAGAGNAGGLLAFGGVLGMAAASGGYFPQSWGWAALVLAWTAALALLLGSPRRPSRLELAFVGGLLAVAAWTGLSAVWSQSVPATVLEVERDAVYLAGLAAALVLTRRGVEDGVLAAAVVVCAWNLVSRLHGYDSSVPGAGAQPIGYANGLGLLAAMGTVLALRRPRTLPALAVLVPALVLADSDGSYLALAAGIAVALRPRLAPLVALGAAVVVLAGLHGHERARYWDVALADAGAQPALGSGGGTFAQQWIERRKDDLSTVDAHSLELETLAELGVVGLAVLAGTISLPFVRGGGAALGAYAAWVVQSGIDWEWELPAVTLAGLLCGLAALARPLPGDESSLGRGGRAAGVAVALGLAAFALVGLVGNRRIAQAEAYRRANDPRALAAADSAARWAPWSAEPLRVRYAVTGSLPLLRRAIAKDPHDWSLWQLLAEHGSGAEKRRAAAKAARLNPLGAGKAPSG